MMCDVPSMAVFCMEFIIIISLFTVTVAEAETIFIPYAIKSLLLLFIYK
jgi:hypothetical protein